MQPSVTTVPTVCSRLSLAAILLTFLVPLSGCRICNNTEDLAYPSYGGAWERTIRDSGRVGSLFDPAGAKSSTLNSKDTAVTQDELERDRRNAEEASNPSSQDEQSADEMTPDDENADEELELDDEIDDELKRRMEELREQDLDDVKIIPGDSLPPLLR